jgi:Domain of unknown function (DUF4280)
MSQTGQEYVCSGALCRCDKGTIPVPLNVTSQQKVFVQEKLAATNRDKTFAPFGTCALKNNSPCVPTLLLWENVFDLVTVITDGCHPLLDKSSIKCAVGGTVSVLTTLQIAVPTPPATPRQLEQARTASMSLCPIMMLDPTAQPAS